MFDRTIPFSGRIWKVGDNIDTDQIVPSHVLTTHDLSKLLAATLEVVIPDFSRKVNPGDIILAGKNFGCGSSREEAVFVLKELQVGVIIAQSFARIFYRNCINLGLPAIIIPKAYNLAENGDLVQINLKKGHVFNLSNQQKFDFDSFPPFVMNFIKKGGVINILKEK